MTWGYIGVPKDRLTASCLRRTVKWGLAGADQGYMAAMFVDDVVSPELALVDPDLADRARAALPLRGPTERARAARAQQLSVVDRAPRRRRIAPVVALASLGAASVLGSGLLRVGPVVGDSPSASGIAISSATTSESGLGSTSAAPGSTVPPPGTAARFTQVVAATDAVGQGSVSPSVGTPQATLSPATGSTQQSRAGVLAPGVPLRPMTLVWARVPGVSSYDIELVRNGSRIYAASSSSPRVDVPRTWTHGGLRFAIQPEDQAFVWPVIDGRRAAEPVVNGTLAFDKTLIAHFTG